MIIRVSHITKFLLFSLMLCAISLLSAAEAAPVAPGQPFQWRSNGKSEAAPANYGFRNPDLSVLAQGSLVQLIWAGPNGQIDPPDTVTGAGGGDDVVLHTSIINNNSPDPNEANKGYVAATNFAFDSEDPWNGGTVYIRAWNAAGPGSAGGATAYGNSISTATLTQGGSANFVTGTTGNPGTTNNSATPPDITVRDGSLTVADGGGPVHIGSTNVGTAVVKTFTVINTGSSNLTLSGPISVPSGFNVASSFSKTTLAKNEQATFAIRLTAATAGSFSGQLSFANNDPDENPYNFTITGVVSAPEIEVRDGGTVLQDGVSAVNFGTATAGAPLLRTFEVKNIGSSNLTLSALNVSGTGFALETGFASTTVQPGQTTTFVVRMTAPSAGAVSGAVTFTNNDADENPFNFTLAGTVRNAPGAAAPEISVSNSTSTVANGTGQVNLGTTADNGSVSQTLTVSNSGDATLTLSGLSCPANFSCALGAASVAPGASTTLQLSLNAASPTIGSGTYVGTVSFANNDADENPFSFTVSAAVYGSTAEQPEISLQNGTATLADGNSTLNFGTTNVGAPVIKSITVKNSGTENLVLGNLSLPAGYSLVGALSSSIAPGGSASLQVQLDAAAAGTYTGVLSLTNNDANENPFDVTLTGSVTSSNPAPEISVLDGSTAVENGSVVNFAATQVGTATSRTFTVRNTGNGYLNLSGLSVPGGYTITSNFGTTTLAPNATTTFTVRLNATAEGLFIGELQFGTNDGDENPFRVTLISSVNAPGSAPKVTVSAGTKGINNGGQFDFAAVGPGPITFTVRNTGNAKLFLANLTVPAGFEITSGFASTLVDPGQSTTFAIKQVGSNPDYSGLVSFATNDAAANPFTFSLRGQTMLYLPLIIKK